MTRTPETGSPAGNAAPGGEAESGGVKKMADKKPWTPAKCPKDCVYRGMEYTPGLAGCNYLTMTDRIRGCDPGKGCTCYKKKETGYKRPSGVVLGDAPRKARRTKWDAKKGFTMWMTGSNDRQIAQALGISANAVGERRRRYWVHGRA